MRKANVLFCLLFWVCLSCQRNTSEPEINYLTSPAEKSSELPNLFTSKSGEIYLSWVETSGEESELRYSQLIDQEWTASMQISAGDNWFVNWADFPSLIAGDDFMAAHWLQKSAEGTYDYDVNISTSRQGKEWSSAFLPHQDGIQAEHGFVSMLPMENEQFFVTWLDGRNTKTTHTDHQSMEHTGAMTLRAGIFDLDGHEINSWELDDRTCDCCQTAAAMSTKGPIVVYRDRSESEIRDIYLTKYEEGNWTSPIPVANDLWEIAGCPVNGPDIAISGQNLAVIWYSASGNTPKVQFAISEDLGDSFQPPVTLGEGNTLGRVGISPYTDGRFVVTWMESKNENALIKMALINHDGSVERKIDLAETSMERASGFPSITTKDSKVIAAWTVNGEKNSIQTVTVEFE